MKPPLESTILAQCLQTLKLYGILCWRQNSGGMRATYKGKERFLRFNTMPGVSDILGVLPPNGRLLAVECKRPGGKLTDDQRAFLEIVGKQGGLAFVCRSVGELEAALRKEKVIA